MPNPSAICYLLSAIGHRPSGWLELKSRMERGALARFNVILPGGVEAA
jgi:hypothetical protein